MQSKQIHKMMKFSTSAINKLVLLNKL